MSSLKEIFWISAALIFGFLAIAAIDAAFVEFVVKRFEDAENSQKLTKNEERRQTAIEQTKCLLRSAVNDQSLAALKNYTDVAMKDLLKVEDLVQEIQKNEKPDRKTAAALANLCAKYERLTELVTGGDFCVFCVVQYRDDWDRHYDSRGVLITAEIRRKNNLDFLLHDNQDSSKVLEYIFIINSTPRREYLPIIRFFQERLTGIKSYYRFDAVGRDEILEIISRFLVDCRKAAEDFGKEFRFSR
jgi:hypothetical protein